MRLEVKCLGISKVREIALNLEVPGWGRSKEEVVKDKISLLCRQG